MDVRDGEAPASTNDDTGPTAPSSEPAALSSGSSAVKAESPAGTLEALVARALEWAPGPHLKSNWVVEGVLCVGGWPSALNGVLDEGSGKAAKLVAAGLEVFVNLTRDDEHSNYARGKECSYARFQSLTCQALAKTGKKRRTQDVFVACPAEDGTALDDAPLEALLCRLVADVAGRRPIYVHCREGKGRTGLVACSLLCLLFPDLSVERARSSFNVLLDSRMWEQERRADCDVGLYDPRHFPHPPEVAPEDTAQMQTLMRVKAAQTCEVEPFACLWRLGVLPEARQWVRERVRYLGEV